MPATDPEPLLSVAQAATLLGVHPNTIRSWTDAGRLTAYRINARGDRRFRRTDVERLLVEDGPGVEAAWPAPAGTGGSSVAAHIGLFARIANGLAASPNGAAVARTVVEAVRSELGASRCAVYLAEDDGLRLAAHAGYASAPPATRQAGEEAPGHPDDVELELATRRGTAGLLALDAPTSEAMPASLRSALVATVATMLASARLLQRARRDLQRARALRSVTKELTGTLELDRLLADVVDVTRTLFDADKAGLWLLDEGEHPFRIAAHHGLGDPFLAQVAQLPGDADTIGIRALQARRAYTMGRADEEQGIGLMRATYAAEGIRTVCLVPLLGRDRPLGLLGLYHLTDHRWPDDEVALVQAFADQAAIALQNARLYRSVADQAARIRSIQDLSARLNRLTDVRSIGAAIVDEARTLAEYHDIRIYIVDRERAVCEPIAFTRKMLDGVSDDAEARLRVRIGEGFTGWVAEHGEPLLINDALDDDRGKTIDGTDDVPESMLVVPMLYEGRALGVIVLSQLGFNRFTEDDLQTMSIFAGYAAQAMVNAETYEQLVAQSGELERRADSQRRLLEISARLLGTLDHEGVLESIADGLRDVVAYDNLSIYRTDPTRRLMVPVLTRERHAAEVRRYLIPFGRGLMGWAVEHGEPILANDALADPRALQIPGTPAEPEAIAVVPLIAEGEVLGTLNVSRVGGPEVAFSTNDFELIQLFAAQASIALRNADAHHAMSQRADTDALTGLGNHGAFQRFLGDRIEAAAREARAAGRRVALLMMDLDSFKAFNDRHGHPAGDALLHRAATAIYGAARSDDRVFRYGGDEFAVVLPGADAAEAERLAERIRRAVARLTADDPTPVTITIGVATHPADAADRAGLIGAADTALFFGKRSGEDRVVRVDQLPNDVGELRGQLEQLASAAVRESDDEHLVEHLVERATGLAVAHDGAASVRDALLAVSRALDARAVARRGDADRIGRLAGELAAALGLAPDAVQTVELAARLHGLDDRGVADLAAVPSLRDLAAVIVGARQLAVEGTRRRHRTGRARGRAAVHVVAVVTAYDERVSGRGRARVGRHEALEDLRADPATYRTDVLEALARTVHGRRDAGRRRRRGDAMETARGAA